MSHVTTLPNNSRSELTISSASQNDSGYYECVVFDGYQLLDSGDVDYFAVILSKRATLQVLGKSQCMYCASVLLYVSIIIRLKGALTSVVRYGNLVHDH